ncbi:MAG: choice-of-anchor Q domain-containing protein [Kiritimatiellae bacterium]|nr:choice-of-anchor Q domain-containing protein [Kiritimatiellia bacterium]
MKPSDRLSICVVALVALPWVSLAGMRFVSTNGNDVTGDGMDWGTAWASVTNAVIKATAGDTIVVSNGTYGLAQTVRIDKDLTLRGFSGNPRDTIVDAGNRVIGAAGSACFYVISNTVLIEALTIQNSQNYGVYLAGTGTVRNCILNRHRAGYGAGIVMDRGGLVENSLICSNQGLYVAAVNINYSGTLRNCLVVDNENTWDSWQGAGVCTSYGGLIESCTITRNVAQNCGGLFHVYNAAVVANSILYNNRGAQAANYVGVAGNAIFSNACVYPNQTGSGNTGADPQFADFSGGNFRLLPSSPCVNTGASADWMASATDLDGHARTNGVSVDMGCYELPVGVLGAGFSSTNPAAIRPGQIVFNGGVVGTNTSNVSYYWDYDNDGTVDASGVGRSTTTGSYASAGVYSVALTVSNGLDEADTLVRSNYVQIAPAITYAALSTNTPAYPYDSWGTAASNVQDAVNAAVDGCQVLVGPGRYVLTNNVLVNKRITLRSYEGKRSTLLDGNGVVRGLYLDHPNAIVDGFTITNCYVPGGLTAAGVHIFLGGTLTNCTIVNCRAGGNTAPGGFRIDNIYGTVSHCVVEKNTAGNYAPSAGLLYHGTLRNSVIANNSNHPPYAVAIGTDRNPLIESCTIAGNSVSGTGAGTVGGVRSGIYGLRIYNTIIRQNYVAGVETNWLFSAPFTALNLATFPAVGVDCVTADPLFKDPVTFELKPDSPCLNAGTNMPWMTGALDIQGNPRVLAGKPDIGAYEVDIRGTVFLLL